MGTRRAPTSNRSNSPKLTVSHRRPTPDAYEAAVATDAPPLAGLVAAGGGAIEGLRLLDGDLVLKIEHDGRAVQILLRDAGPFPEGAGIELRHPFGLRMPHGVRRLLDFWQVAGRSPPPR